MSSSSNDVSKEFPDYYVIPVADMVPVLREQWSQRIQRFGQENGVNVNVASMIDVGKIIYETIESIKAGEDAEMEISMLAFRDIGGMAIHGIGQTVGAHQNYAVIALSLDLGGIVADFGMTLYQRLKQLRFYTNGYFPYHFSAWMGDDILVKLDDVHAGVVPHPETSTFRLY